MRILRTASTRRLLAAVASVIVVALGGAAIAIAATAGGPVPPRRSLPQALHAALTAPPVQGITARVTFINRLIDTSAIQGSDPLLTGGSGRLWVAPGQGLRLEIQSDNGDAQVVVRGRSFWAYDPASHTVYEGALPASAPARTHREAPDAIPSLAQIQSALTRLADHVTLSPAMPTDVAGRPAYTVRVSPAGGGGLLGGLSVAWDAIRGVPLRFDVFARGDSSPVIELTATHVSFGRVARSVFAMTPPSGATVVHVALPAAGAAARADHHVARGAVRYAFTLDAPATLAGRARTAIEPLAGGRAALITYGHGLSAIEVLERPGKGTALPSAAGDQPGLSLPTVSIDGASAQELPTALGTVLAFSRHGLSFTVAGSLPPATVQQAARAL